MASPTSRLLAGLEAQGLLPPAQAAAIADDERTRPFSLHYELRGLLFLVLEGYLQVQYGLFGTRYGLVTVLPAVLFSAWPTASTTRACYHGAGVFHLHAPLLLHPAAARGSRLGA